MLCLMCSFSFCDTSVALSNNMWCTTAAHRYVRHIHIYIYIKKNVICAIVSSWLKDRCHACIRPSVSMFQNHGSLVCVYVCFYPPNAMWWFASIYPYLHPCLNVCICLYVLKLFETMAVRLFIHVVAIIQLATCVCINPSTSAVGFLEIEFREGVPGSEGTLEPQNPLGSRFQNVWSPWVLGSENLRNLECQGSQ